MFSRQRASTAKIESGDDVEGWDSLSSEDQEDILARVANRKFHYLKKLLVAQVLVCNKYKL